MTNPVRDIRPLSPATLDDYLAFFDGPAFSDNPRWASCYCQCYYEDHRRIDWKARTGSENRALACSRTVEGTMQGLLAYADGKVVGWCNAAPRQMLHAYDELPAAQANAVGTIVCFLVHPAHRGQGIAKGLLDAACDHLAAQGMRIAEAHPRQGVDGSAANYHGTISMYLAAGFSPPEDDGSGDGGIVMRRVLRPTGG